MEIERHVKDCNTCQIYSRQPPVAPLHPWEWPGRTWHRIHFDYAGPFEGRMLLIIIDAHSKFIDAHIVSSATTCMTLTKLRQTYSFTGLPHTIVSDNGSCFTSDEFEQFCRANGIKHMRCSPYHPSSNRAVEHAIQTVKFGLRKSNFREPGGQVVHSAGEVPSHTSGYDRKSTCGVHAQNTATDPL